MLIIIYAVINTEIVLQEPLMISDAEALETVRNLKDDEFDDQKAKSEKILKAVDELNAVQVDITNSLVIENENTCIVEEEKVDELKEKAEQLDESHFIADSLVINNQDNKGKFWSSFLRSYGVQLFFVLDQDYLLISMRVYFISYMRCLLCLLF